ncbi:DUF6286 domain-containing protein [Nonomuraea longicatena]|uniref:DUF6286 domain-containing protein n=1 Tax=Nonomuraea longicatena TaxID=83682 RepID=A0ABN1P2M9_9ACTN
MRSAADRAAVREFRPRRTVPATIVALLLLLLGVLVAGQVISSLAGRPLGWLPVGRMLDWASATSWQSPPVLLGAAVIALAGLFLLVLAVKPGRPRLVPVTTGDPGLIIGMRPKSVADALAHAASEVPGVRAAEARLRARTVTVTATTSGWDDENTGAAVEEAVNRRLADIGPVEPYQVLVRLRELR